MRDRTSLPVDSVAPPRGDIFALLGMPDAGRHEAAAAAALDALRESARPVGVVQDIDPEALDAVLAGGQCPRETPVGRILPNAERLALYAVTLGPEVGGRITALFAAGEELAGLFLDAAASCAADRASRAVVERTLGRWGRERGVGPGTAALGFSPGYCGWPVEGQRALFAVLRPEEAGILLGKSCLMEPLKSVSGAVLAGPSAIFGARKDYPFCEGCGHPDCGERTRSMPVWNG